jgi:hypothetical protein
MVSTSVRLLTRLELPLVHLYLLKSRVSSSASDQMLLRKVNSALCAQ